MVYDGLAMVFSRFHAYLIPMLVLWQTAMSESDPGDVSIRSIFHVIVLIARYGRLLVRVMVQNALRNWDAEETYWLLIRRKYGKRLLKLLMRSVKYRFNNRPVIYNVVYRVVLFLTLVMAYSYIAIDTGMGMDP